MSSNTSIPTKSKQSIYKYEGDDVKDFVKKIVRMLYDADIADVIFIDGNQHNLMKNNVWIKAM